MSFPSKILWAFSSLEHVHWRGFRWTARQEEIALCIIFLATGHENWHLQLCGEVRRNSCHLLQSLVQGRSKSELDLASCFCVERRRVRPVAVPQPEKQVVVCAGRSHTCLMVQEGSTGCKVQPGCRTASAVWFWCQESERPSLKTEILTTGRDFDFLWISCFFFSFSSFAVSHFQCMIIFTLAVPPLCLQEVNCQHFCLEIPIYRAHNMIVHSPHLYFALRSPPEHELILQNLMVAKLDPMEVKHDSGTARKTETLPAACNSSAATATGTLQSLPDFLGSSSLQHSQLNETRQLGAWRRSPETRCVVGTGRWGK